MIVYTFAWDDDNGTGCSVHATERERDLAFIDHVTDDPKQRQKARRILRKEDGDLWAYLEDNCFEHLATYGLDQDTIPDKGLRAALAKLKETFDGDSNDAEHDAAFELTELLESFLGVR